MSYLKRIIYCLYFMDNNFHLSRNFSLQKVGDLNWLNNNFEFGLSTGNIDELMVILVKKNPNQNEFKEYFKTIEKLKKNIFIPITLGGGISTYEISKNFFESGADKILINTFAYKAIDLIDKISGNYGSQAISIGVDYKKNENQINLYSNCGNILEKIKFEDHLNKLEQFNCGELILNSIDNDGNGAGLDLSITKKIKDNYSKPILLMGGAGKPEHFAEGLKKEHVSGVVSANLFNFLGSGLKNVRLKLIEDGINIAKFD